MDHKTNDQDYTFHFKSFSELTTDELYDLLSLRQEVFIVEQDCNYRDADGLDKDSHHLFAKDNGEMVACLRITAPGSRYAEPSIGRVLTAKPWRNRGLCRAMMTQALDRCRILYPDTGIQLSSQVHLQDFYASFGFTATGGTYLEDGIPHIQMILQ